MKDLSHLFETIPISTDRAGACAQIENELIERGHDVSDGPSRTAIWCEPQPGSLHGFWVYGSPDLSVHIKPDNRVGDQPNRGQAYWILEYTLCVCLKHDPADPLRVNRLHEKTARVLRNLGFEMTEEDEHLDCPDGASEQESQWSHRANDVAHAVDLIMALREIESSQYPDGDLWMGGNCPPPPATGPESRSDWRRGSGGARGRPLDRARATTRRRPMPSPRMRRTCPRG